MSWADGLTLEPPLTLARRTVNADGEVKSEVFKRAGRDPDTAVKIPDAIVGRTSTLYDNEKNVVAQWVIERPEDRQRIETLREFVDGLKSEMPPIPTLPLPQRPDTDNLLTAYPIGDHHVGMLSWRPETGESYDIDIGVKLLTGAMQHLVTAAPASKRALVVGLGDFLHYDGYESLTPKSRHLLDSDGRAPKMIREGARLMRRVIELAAAKHELVHVILESGNHDLTGTAWLAELLWQVYENNDRITIDTSPSRFHYYEFGKCLIATNHGDARAAKPNNLPGILLADQPEACGRTKYRYWWTGHIHNQRVHDLPGCLIESFRILPPPDAYASNEGYRSGRDMKSIVLHREFGEVARNVVNPDMLRSST